MFHQVVLELIVHKLQIITAVHLHRHAIGILLLVWHQRAVVFQVYVDRLRPQLRLLASNQTFFALIRLIAQPHVCINQLKKTLIAHHSIQLKHV